MVDTADYWQLNLCTKSRVLISFRLVKMSASEAEKAWLMRQPAKGLPWLLRKSNDQDVKHMKTVAEALLQGRTNTNVEPSRERNTFADSEARRYAPIVPIAILLVFAHAVYIIAWLCVAVFWSGQSEKSRSQ